MKSQFLLLLLVLPACATNESDDASRQTQYAAQGTQDDLDTVATGSTCDSPSQASAPGFAPAAGVAGSTAIAKDSASIIAWASQVVDVDYGESVDDQWKAPGRALGPAQGTSTDVVSLGEGGVITLGFDMPITNGVGPDLCVFENSFSDDFLELGYVEVASNEGVFVRFAAYSQVSEPVDAFGTIETTQLDGFAGKYRQGYCTPFDLALLLDRPEVASGALDLSSIRYVRIRDSVGDGRDIDCAGTPIFDPYPTTGGAGFDLDAIAVLAAPTP
jgi:hypothetical protein